MEKEKCAAPVHMDLYARNARLYGTLKSMGLYIEPYYNDYDDILFLAVSAGRSMRIEPVYRDEAEKEIAFWKISKLYPLTEEEIKSMMPSGYDAFIRDVGSGQNQG